MAGDYIPTVDQLQATADPIVKLVDMVIQQGLLQERAVREEIERKGTYWAAQEIYRLRRRVTMFEKREREA